MDSFYQIQTNFQIDQFIVLLSKVIFSSVIEIIPWHALLPETQFNLHRNVENHAPDWACKGLFVC